MNVRRMTSERPVDLARTLFPLRRGTGDPTMRIGSGEAWRATRTPEGPATVHVSVDGAGLRAEAWGTGAVWALDHAPSFVGLTDDDSQFQPHHGVIADLFRRLRAVRITRTERPTEALIPAVLEQKVTGVEARRAYRRLASALSEPAPGPAGLLMPPDPAGVAALPYHAFHPFGVARSRAETLRFVCARASAIDALTELPPLDARAHLTRFPGIGGWTAAEVARLSLGDADAVSVGDFHLPNLVTWALAGEARGTDRRMLELLEPYLGHRGRVQVLLEAGGVRAPRFGPRMDVPAIERI